MNARRRRRLENAVRRAGDALLRAGDADEGLDFVVIRSDVVVRDRPVDAQAVAVVRLEIPGGETKRKSPIVVRTSAEDARTEPTEFAARRHRVGFSLELPAAKRSREISERVGVPVKIGVAVLSGAAVRNLVRPHVLLVVPGRVEHRTSLEQSHVDALFGQHLDHRSPASPGADHHHIVNGPAAYYLHVQRLYGTLRSARYQAPAGSHRDQIMTSGGVGCD